MTTRSELLAPIRKSIGAVVLRKLTADDVLDALKESAATRASRTVRDTRANLERVITYAQARGLVARNVAALIKAPPGTAPGRPSRALNVDRALAVLQAARADRIYAYVVLSLLTGIRTEEAARCGGTTSTWRPSRPAWPSGGRCGRTVTSRRPAPGGRSCSPREHVGALRSHRERQAEEREAAGKLWTDTGLVFTTTLGGPLDAANVRRSFRRNCKAAGIGENWTPRELRHTFVSVMSDAKVPIERIADLLGHAGGSRVTETGPPQPSPRTLSCMFASPGNKSTHITRLRTDRRRAR
ncbi:MAG TPA: tyrosine-type recombinase/integrase [Streptosporangiaceae bacterium]|nr:tyrosine-type recombinase/integrase [Streptosporangiaceae bacterium]